MFEINIELDTTIENVAQGFGSWSSSRENRQKPISTIVQYYFLRVGKNVTP